ncbi:tRNA 2-thiouridine(34) synthase MnmA [Geminicoccus harenae]|uniref:tRNA 2-thiouridine(34) synthase MnmA n=2 Tax=Geminicoccus harenae TaxID=2498453 RepID=UPI002AC34C9D|nr:tRNA 2-thiouridine(34) synthase MnmA [Geminicoccus harenae]
MNPDHLLADLDLPAGARVVVAMSGGVDSSVCAGLLAEAGFDVVGITMQLYDHGQATGRAGSCCAGRDIRDARAVADRLGIPHFVLDYEERFRRQVIDEFAAGYAAGRTPIPCVRCNERIKFGDLLESAQELGAAALVTGHYVRRLRTLERTELHRGRDSAKDQSYFLFATTDRQLARLRFPLGGLTKAETRAHAQRLGLPVAEKAESQDICFVPDGDHASVVTALRPEAGQSGEIVDDAGRVLGRHKGLAGITVGQRRGLGVAAPERMYVTEIDPVSRRVTIAPKARARMRSALLDRLHLVGAAAAGELPGEVMAKHRYNEPAQPATVQRDEAGRVEVVFREPQLGIARGQACVLYDGSRLLGGGWIERAAA